MTEYFDWWNGQPTDPQLEGLPDSRRRDGAEAPRRVRGIVRAVGPVRRERARRDRPRCDSRRHRERDRRRGGRAHTRIADHRGENPPRAASRSCTRTREAAARGAERRHVDRASPPGGRRARVRSSPELVHAASVEEAVRLLAAGEARSSAVACRMRCAASAPAFRRRSGSIAIDRIPELNDMAIDAHGTLRAGAAVQPAGALRRRRASGGPGRR